MAVVTAPAGSAGFALTVEGSASLPTHPDGEMFHEVLSALNPLQYLPVVGTIYRAVTGDTIPEPVRDIGSLALSGLMGGPIGIAVNLGLLACEKLTGIDPEEIGQHLLASLHLTPHEASHSEAVQVAQTATAAPVADVGVPAPSLGWSPAALAAYGVSQTSDGTLSRGDLRGADVLNEMEIARINQHS